jgi:hypothetical protein
MELVSCYTGVVHTLYGAHRTRDSVVSIMTKLRAGRFGFRIPVGAKDFLPV